jgi:hypothetical protein
MLRKPHYSPGFGAPVVLDDLTLGSASASWYRPKGLGYSSNSDKRRMMRSGRIGESGGRPTP